MVGGVDNPSREGLVSFWVEGRASADIVTALREEGIRVHVRKDDHYSGNILKPMGLPACIRVSVCHYNTRAEVGRILGAMKAILAA